MEVQLVDKILSADGSVVTDKEPNAVTPARRRGQLPGGHPPGNARRISVEDGGTAREYFVGYPYTDQIGAKTGTAQVNLIDVEDNAWFVAFAPFDEPEIAVVVFIANGYKGAVASLTSKDVIAHYMEQREKPRHRRDPGAGQLHALSRNADKRRPPRFPNTGSAGAFSAERALTGGRRWLLGRRGRGRTWPRPRTWRPGPRS